LGVCHPSALRDPRYLALWSLSCGLSMAHPLEHRPSTDFYRNHRFCTGAVVSFASGWSRRPGRGRLCLHRNLLRWMVAPRTLGQTGMMKRVFITGASSGIGLAMAKLLVAEGHQVWGTSRNLERIPKMPQWHAIRLDLADSLSVETAFNAALTDAGYFDVVINNAGAGHFDPAELVPMETITS